MTKIQRQLPASRMPAAISGPRIRKVVPPVASSPIAQPRRSSGITRVVLLSTRGWRSAPPIPCSARKAIRAPIEGASAQAAEPSAKRAMPASRVRRRPTWSAMRPARTMNTASGSRYAVMVQRTS